MCTRRFGQRDCERKRWLSFHFICDVMDLPVATKRMMRYDDGREEPLLAAVEINAACNTTIVLARMIRNGKRGTIDPGSKGP